MGLAERRAVKAFQDEKLGALTKSLNDAAGFDVALEIDWDALAIDGFDHMYEEAWTKIFFKPVEAAFSEICCDDMGKEALQAALKQLVFKNSGQFSNPSGITFEGGVLTVDHKADSNIDDVAARTKGLVAILEKSL